MEDAPWLSKGEAVEDAPWLAKPSEGGAQSLPEAPWTVPAADRSNVTYGEQFVEAGKNVAAGAVDPVSGLLKGVGASVSAGTPEAHFPPGYQQLQQAMTPEDTIPPELSYPRATSVTESKIFQAGKALEERTASLLGLREGVLPPLARDVSRGFGQLGTNIGLSMVPGGAALVAGAGALGGIGEAGERAAQAGATPQQQQAALKYGGLAGATELADTLIPKLGTAGQALAFVQRVGVKAILGALTEGGQEGLQQLIQNWGAKQEYKPDQSLTEDVAYNMLVGGIVGGGAGGALAGRRAEPAQQPGVPGQEVPTPELQTQPGGVPASQPPAEAPGTPLPAVPVSAIEQQKEVLQAQRFDLQKQAMIAEELGDDASAQLLEEQRGLLSQQLRSLAAGAADPLAAEAELARRPLRQQLEESVALIPAEGREDTDISSRGRGGPVSTTSPPQTAEPEAPAAPPAPEAQVPQREAAESRTIAPPIQEEPEWYYSAVERVAREKLPSSGSVEQFWSTLSKAQGVKQEELEVLGVREWLDAAYGPRPKVSKEDLLTHLAERSVKVETEVFGGMMAEPWTAVQVPGRNPNPDFVLPAELSEEFPPNTIPFQTRYTYPVYQAWGAPGGWMVVRGDGGFYVVDSAGYILGRAHRTLGAAQIDAEERINPGRKARYDSYIPKLGGTNSREIVLRTPRTTPYAPPQLPKDWTVGTSPEPDGQWYVWGDEGHAMGFGPTQAGAIEAALAQAEEAGLVSPRGRGTGDVYSTDHFTNIPNKIGWAQVDDVTTVDGKRVLRVRAVQDDTRQKGASEGFRDPKRIAALKAAYARFDAEYKAKEKVDDEMKALYDRNDVLYKRLNEINSTHQPKVWDAIYGEIRSNTQQLDTMREAHREWMEIGVDRTQARIDVERAEKGQPDVPFKNQWHEVVVKRLLRLAADEGYDGVAFAPPSQPIAEWRGATNPKLAKYFEDFYGKKVPQAYRKWGKQLDGKVEQFSFVAEAGGFSSLKGVIPEQTMTWEGVTVTPEMRTQVKKGVPLFSKTVDGPKGLAFVSAEQGTSIETILKFGPDLYRFVQAMEVMQEKFGMRFPIEIKLSERHRTPGTANSTIDSKTGRITKGEILLGARFFQNPGEIYATLQHEFGHLLLWHHEESMPMATRRKVDADYEQFRRENWGRNTAFEDMILRRDNFITAQESFRVTTREGEREGRGTRSNDLYGDLMLTSMLQEDRNYWLGKDEWQAEQIARFMTTNEQALTVVERFHKSFANKLREMYTYFKKKFGLQAEPSEAMQDWLLQIMRREDTVSARIAAGKDKFSQRKNQLAMDEDGASMDAVPESGATQDTRRLLAESATLPPNAQKNGRALAAYADYFNAVYKYMAGLPHLAGANTHIGPLQRYNEINQQWDLEVSNMVDGGTRVLKQWRDLSQPQQDAMTGMLDDYRMMRYLTAAEVQQGVERMPSPIELDALAAKHGVTPQSQVVFREIVKSYTEVVGKYRQELRRQARKISDPLRRQVAYHDIDVQINAILKKPYIPGMQFGNHTIIVRDAGKIIYREAFDTQRKRNAALAQIKAQMPPTAKIETGFVEKDVRPLVGLPPGLLDLIEQKLALSPSQQVAIEELKFELHPTQGFKHRFSNQNLVAGSSKDFQRGYANFFFHGAHYFGRVKWHEAAKQEAADLKESAQGLYQQGGTLQQLSKRENIAQYVENHLNYRLNPKQDFAFLRSLGFLWYLGFVPAAALLNVTQIPLATLPFLSAKFGDRKTWTAVLQAGARMSTYYKKGTMATQTDEELWALDQGIKSGTITEAMAPEMAAIAELDNLTRSTKGYLSRTWHNTLEWSAKQFELAEQFNRRVTFRAAYQLARANPNAKYVQEAVRRHQLQYDSILAQNPPNAAQRAAAFVAAKDATEQTQGIYKQYAEPKVMRGKARTVLLFKSFYVNTLAMYWNNKDARLRGLLAFTALGGLMGAPFTEDIKGIVRLIGAGLGKDWDLEKEMKKILMGLLGDDEAEDAEWADLILHGMSRIGFGAPAALQHLGVPGPKVGNDPRSGQVDMSKSISLGRGIPIDLNQLATASNTEKAALRSVAQAGGPVYGGLGMSLFKFLDGGGYGWDDRKRYEYIMPRFLKSVSTGFRAFEEGRERNAKGETVIRYDRTDPWQVAETISLALGFQPARLTAEWDRRMARLEDTTYWAARQQTIMQQLWLSRGDPEEFARVQGALRSFNQEVAGSPAAMYAITGDAVRQSFLMRAKGAQAAETGIPVRKREIPIARDVERLYPAPRVTVEKERVR